jgi:hypothetical protein
MTQILGKFRLFRYSLAAAAQAQNGAINRAITVHATG